MGVGKSGMDDGGGCGDDAVLATAGWSAQGRSSLRKGKGRRSVG